MLYNEHTTGAMLCVLVTVICCVIGGIIAMTEEVEKPYKARILQLVDEVAAERHKRKRDRAHLDKIARSRKDAETQFEAQIQQLTNDVATEKQKRKEVLAQMSAYLQAVTRLRNEICARLATTSRPTPPSEASEPSKRKRTKDDTVGWLSGLADLRCPPSKKVKLASASQQAIVSADVLRAVRRLYANPEVVRAVDTISKAWRRHLTSWKEVRVPRLLLALARARPELQKALQQQAVSPKPGHQTRTPRFGTASFPVLDFDFVALGDLKNEVSELQAE